jgi:hypothetical protein
LFFFFFFLSFAFVVSGVLGQSGLRTQGRAMLEERDWVLWLNHILSRSGKKSASGAPIRIANVGRDLADGTVLMHVLEFLIGHALTT